MLEVIGPNPIICTVTNREGHSYQGDFLAAGSQSDFFGTAVVQEKRLPPLLIERSPNDFSQAWPFLSHGPRYEAAGARRAEFRVPAIR
jgi:hypothetical protein